MPAACGVLARGAVMAGRSATGARWRRVAGRLRLLRRGSSRVPLEVVGST